MFQRADLAINEDDIGTLVEIYGRFKTDGPDNKGSEDVLAVIVQGPAPNHPANTNAVNAYNYVKAQRAGGRPFQTPKVGTIRYTAGDVVARTRSKVAFQGRCEDSVVFSKESKWILTRKPMVHLVGGDTYFNEWPVKTLPFSKLARCSMAVHDKIFFAKDYNPLVHVC